MAGDLRRSPPARRPGIGNPIHFEFTSFSCNAPVADHHSTESRPHLYKNIPSPSLAWFNMTLPMSGSSEESSSLPEESSEESKTDGRAPEHRPHKTKHRLRAHSRRLDETSSASLSRRASSSFSMNKITTGHGWYGLAARILKAMVGWRSLGAQSLALSKIGFGLS